MLPPTNFTNTDVLEISVEKKDKSMGISYSGGVNSTTSCGNPCKLGIVEMMISY